MTLVVSLLLVIVFVVVGLYSCEQNYQVLVHMFLVLVQWLMNFQNESSSDTCTWWIIPTLSFVVVVLVVLLFDFEFCCCCFGLLFMNWLCFPVGWLVDLHL